MNNETFSDKILLQFTWHLSFLFHKRMGFILKMSKLIINLNFTSYKSDNHESQIRLSDSKILLEMSSSTWIMSDPVSYLIQFKYLGSSWQQIGISFDITNWFWTNEKLLSGNNMYYIMLYLTCFLLVFSLTKILFLPTSWCFNQTCRMLML